MISQFQRLLCIAALLLFISQAPLSRAATQLGVPVDPFLTLRFDLYGQDEASLVKQASISAVESAIGRIYFTDYAIHGLTVLEPYIQENYQNFIARHSIVKSELQGGRRSVSIDIVVDTQKLYNDLDEKKFLYRPALRPVFYIFVKETFDGAPSDPVGRKRLIDMISNGANSPTSPTQEVKFSTSTLTSQFLPKQRTMYRYLWQEADADIPAAQKHEVVIEGLSNTDPTETTATMEAACNEAQRNEVEVFFAGAIETKTTRAEKVYFNDYTFVATHVSLKLVRSDTCEVLASAETTATAGNVDVKEAIRTATLKAIQKTAPQLFAKFDKTWAKTMLRKADIRMMVIGADQSGIDLLKKVITGSAPTAEIFTRSHFGDIAVLTMAWNGKKQDIQRILFQTQHPSLHPTFLKPNEIIINMIP